MAGKPTPKKKTITTDSKSKKVIDHAALKGVAGGKAKTADKAFNAMDGYIRG